MTYILAMLSLTTAFVYASLLLFSNDRFSREKYSIAIRFLYGLIFIWCLLYTVFYLAEEPWIAQWVMKISPIFWIPIPALVGHLLLLRSKYKEAFLEKRIISMFYAPSIFLIMLSLTYKYNLVIVDLLDTPKGFMILNRVTNVGYWLFMIYLLTYLILPIYFLRDWVSNRKGFLLKKSGSLLLSVVLVSMFSASISDLILPLTGISTPVLGSIMFIIPGIYLLLTHIGNKYEVALLDTTTDYIIDTMQDLVIIVARNGIIWQANVSALEYLQEDKSNVIGRRIQDTDLSESFSDKLVQWLGNLGIYRNYELKVARSKGKEEYFLVNGMSLNDDLFGVVGYLLVFTDITDRKKMEKALYANYQKEKESTEKLYRLANYDMLTDMPNRRYFFSEIPNIAKVYELAKEDFAFIFIDLNGFKKINDQKGHQCGDEVLKHVARRIKKFHDQLDFYARIGGDEFVLVTNQVTPIDRLMALINNIEEETSSPMLCFNEDIEVTISAGYALFSDYKDIEAMIQAADENMYAKKSRRD